MGYGFVLSVWICLTCLNKSSPIYWGTFEWHTLLPSCDHYYHVQGWNTASRRTETTSLTTITEELNIDSLKWFVLNPLSSHNLSLSSPLTLHSPWEVSVLLEDWLGSQGHDPFLRWSLVSGRTIYLLYFFLRCQSFVSSVGLLFLWSADSIRKGTPNGLEGAFGMNNSPVSNHTILTLVS